MGTIKDILADIGKNPTEFLNQYLETKKVTDQIFNPFLESVRKNSERSNEKKGKAKASKKRLMESSIKSKME